MTILNPYLGPCRDSRSGVFDQSRYEELQLPEPWTAACLAKGKWIAPDEYFWTPDSFFEVGDSVTPQLLREIRSKTLGCFYDLSLAEQCALLGVKYRRMHPAEMVEVCANPPLDAADRVEKFSFDFFTNQGWTGDSYEGATIHLLLFILRRNLEAQGVKLHNYWYGGLSKTIYPGGIYKRERIEPHETEIIEWEVDFVKGKAGRNAAYELWRLHYQSFPMRHLSPEKFLREHFQAVCEGLSQPVLNNITTLMVMGYLGAGWPDLTLQREKALNFVEVKQGADKFTHRQAYWIRNFAVPLALDFTVLHVTPTIKVGLRSRKSKIASS